MTLADHAQGVAPNASDASARLARDVYVHRLRAGTAAMAASLGGIDVLAFTGGVGERSSEIRKLTAEGLGFLGVELDTLGNDAATSDVDLSSRGARVRTVVIEAREDLEISRQTRAVLTGAR